MPPLAVPYDDDLIGLACIARLQIRQAQVGDLEAMAQIAQPLYYEAPTDLTIDGHTTFVACDLDDNDAVAGFLWFLRSTWDGAGFFVRLVMTHGQKGRRGVGPLLMAYAAKAMHNAEPEMPISLVVKDDNHGAKRWYDKLEIYRVLPWPENLDEEESEVAEHERAQYQFRLNDSTQRVIARAIYHLKLTVTGTLVANPEHSPKRRLLFQSYGNPDYYLTFYLQPGFLAYNDADREDQRVTLTSFTDLNWDGPNGSRNYACHVWSNQGLNG